MIVVVDYGMGNLRSVEKAFEVCGGAVQVSSDPRRVRRAEKIVLPGVGAFRQAMRELQKKKLVDPILEKIAAGTPYLGLCLGLQLLFSESLEGGRTKGLGVIRGQVRPFKGRLKVPHMGWNSLSVRKRGCPIFKKVRGSDRFYFVHSFYGVPLDRSWTLATTEYGVPFCSAVWKDNIFATQFHPEKSQAAGLRVIRNFVKL